MRAWLACFGDARLRRQCGLEQSPFLKRRHHAAYPAARARPVVDGEGLPAPPQRAGWRVARAERCISDARIHLTSANGSRFSKSAGVPASRMPRRLSPGHTPSVAARRHSATMLGQASYLRKCYRRKMVRRDARSAYEGYALDWSDKSTYLTEDRNKERRGNQGDPLQPEPDPVDHACTTKTAFSRTSMGAMIPALQAPRRCVATGMAPRTLHRAWGGTGSSTR